MGVHGVFVITGLPGTGKTTLARALARQLAAPLLAKDGIKEPLLDVLGAADRSASRRLSDASFAVLFALAAQHLLAAGSVVLEGNFRPAEHEAPLRALLARQALPGCVQVLCRASETLRQQRLRARATDAARHSGHRDGLWVAPAQASGDAFLDVAGPRLIHDSGVTDPEAGCALIRSLATGQIV